MPKLSKEKKDRISEQILNYLFQTSPQSVFTNQIAKEIARDEEFIKLMLLELSKKNLVVEIKKNSQGIDYSRRQRWRLSNQVYDIYKKRQSKSQNSISNQFSTQSNLENS